MTVVLRAATEQGFLALQRQLRRLAPEIALVTNADQALEHLTPDARPPRLVDADIIEGRELRARRVFGDPEPAFAAFLDGTQASRVVAYIDGTPVIHGTVAAVVRIRRNRRLTTWHRPIVRRRLYACLRAFSPERRGLLHALGLEVIDTTPTSAGPVRATSVRPARRRDPRVQADREEARARTGRAMVPLEQRAAAHRRRDQRDRHGRRAQPARSAS